MSRGPTGPQRHGKADLKGTARQLGAVDPGIRRAARPSADRGRVLILASVLATARSGGVLPACPGAWNLILALRPLS